LQAIPTHSLKTGDIGAFLSIGSARNGNATFNCTRKGELATLVLGNSLIDKWGTYKL
jgi:hypothetical protein